MCVCIYILFCLLVHLSRITELGPLPFFLITLICARLPPLPQLAFTACFDLFSFCRSAYIMTSPNQWSALVFCFLHWQEISLVWLFLAAADSFPTLVFCCVEGKMERISVWVWACEPTWRGQTTSVVEVFEISHMLLKASVLEDMGIYWWYTK